MFARCGGIEGDQIERKTAVKRVRDDLPLRVNEKSITDVGIVGERLVEQVVESQQVVEQDRVGGARREVTRDRNALFIQLGGHGGGQGVARLNRHAHAEQEDKSQHDAEDLGAHTDRARNRPETLENFLEHHG